MLPVGGRPFLEYLVHLLLREGFNRVLFCTSHLAEAVNNHFGNGDRFGITAAYTREPQPMGTGGALMHAREHLDKQFLVLNGDTFFDIPMRQLAELLQRHSTPTAALALRHVEDVGRYGSVRLKSDFVAAFEEKGRTGPGWINGGIYCLKRETLDLLPAGESSLECDLFPQLAAKGLLCAQACDGYFLDIGLPQTLARAQVELPAHFPSNLGHAGPAKKNLENCHPRFHETPLPRWPRRQGEARHVHELAGPDHRRGGQPGERARGDPLLGE